VNPKSVESISPARNRRRPYRATFARLERDNPAIGLLAKRDRWSGVVVKRFLSVDTLSFEELSKSLACNGFCPTNAKRYLLGVSTFQMPD
jgi:hypothetical protein